MRFHLGILFVLSIFVVLPAWANPPEPSSQTTQPATPPLPVQPGSLVLDAEPSALGSSSQSMPGRGLRIAGIATSIVGVSGFGLAVAFNLWERDLSEQIDTSPGQDTTSNRQKRDRIERAARIIYYAAGTTAMTGLVLYFFGNSMDTANEVAFIPTIAPGLTTLTFQRSF